MFAIEQSNRYDPTRPAILDGRPHSMQFSRQQSPFRGSDAVRKENFAPSNRNSSPVQKQSRPEHKEATTTVTPLSPSRFNTSPTKSSLSKKTGAAFRRSGFDPDSGIWEDEDDIQNRQLPEGRGLHRHHKSVTFDQAPPQVNEYEMTTPAPSESCASGSREGSYASTEDDEEEEPSFERGSSIDREDSFDASLEDTAKTPVVLPEDWRFMSPDNANTEMARGEEDVFQEDCGSPAPSAKPGALAYRPHQTSAGSVDSDGHARPLPPLPPTGAHGHSRTESLSGAFERMSVAHRSLPTPPMAAGISKADIQKISTSSSLSAEDRMRLMAIQEQERERRMRRMGSKEASPVRGASADNASVTYGEPGPEILTSGDSTPQLSRASILSGLRDRDSRESSEDVSEASSNREDRSPFDPDVPIPSMEDPTQPRVKEELEEPDLYSIPDMYIGRAGSDSETSANQDDDLTSQYSQASLAPLQPPILNEGQDTPKAQSPVREQPSKLASTEHRVSLPDFPDFGKENSFDMGLGPYLTKNQDKVQPAVAKPSAPDLPDLAALRQSIQRSYTPDIQTRRPQSPLRLELDIARPETPDSVVRHSSTFSGFNGDMDTNTIEKRAASEAESERSTSPSETGSVVVNGKQASPVSPISTDFNDRQESPVSDSADTAATEEKEVHVNHKPAEKKRVSSLVQLDIPYDQLEDSLGLGLEKEFDRVVEAQKVEFELSLRHLYYPFSGRFPSSELPDAKGSRTVHPLENIPVLPKPRGARALPGKGPPFPPVVSDDEDSFANRAGRRQRGYVMRQNTKIVVASERISQEDECKSPTLPSTDGENLLAPPTLAANKVQPSPRKTSQPTWSTEPWNGKIRRKSIRVGGEKAVSKRRPVENAVPPLPGQASNAQENLDAVAEDELGEEEDWEDGAERGRLFVKVVGVKDLQMPFPKCKLTVYMLQM